MSGGQSFPFLVPARPPPKRVPVSARTSKPRATPAARHAANNWAQRQLFCPNPRKSPRIGRDRRWNQLVPLSAPGAALRLIEVSPPPCLPCRRSRVRIPSAASEKACICRSFSLLQSPCSAASGRTHSGLAVRRLSAASRKTPDLQVDSRSSELKSFCRHAEGLAFGLPRPSARLLRQRHDPADSARRRDTSGGSPWGPVRSQSGNREVNLDPLRDRRSMAPRAVSDLSASWRWPPLGPPA